MIQRGLAIAGLFLAVLAIGFVAYLSLSERPRFVMVDGRLLASPSYQETYQRKSALILQKLDADSGIAKQQIAASVDQAIDQAFEPVLGNVERFLDFHYSVVGEYTELTAGVLGDMEGNFQRILFTESGFSDKIAFAFREMDAAHRSILTAQLSKLRAAIALEFALDIEEIALVEQGMTLSIADAEARFAGVNLAAKSGAAAGAALLAARMLSRTLFVKAAAKGGAKLAGKAAGAGAGGSAGVICGPAAVVCVPAFALAGWLLTDKAIVEADEALNRAQFRDEILGIIAAEKQRLKIEATRAYQESYDAVATKNRRSIEEIGTVGAIVFGS